MLEALRSLLASGANTSCRDNSGETPLHLVRNLLRQGLYDKAALIAHILLQAGAHVDAANNEVSVSPEPTATVDQSSRP